MLNNITIMGRLVADPILRKTNNDVEWATFAVAVDREVKGKTDFIPCITWRGTAKFVSDYFKKGQMICCVGRLENNPYEDKGGNKRDGWQVSVQDVYFCGSKSNESFTPINVTFTEEEDDGELPF